jgi:DNA ligase (NAD+)
MIRDPADLYGLEVGQLAKLDRLGERSATNITRAIAASKDRSPSRLLFALGIPHVGSENATLLMRRFGSIRRLQSASREEISDTPGIGPVIAESVWTHMRYPGMIDLLERLEDAGLDVAAEETRVDSNDDSIGRSGIVAGKNFVLTGTLPTLSRREATDLIVAEGGRVTGSVSAKTDYVVVGDEPGSKLAKAERLGLPLLDEAAFLNLLRPLSPEM